MREFLRRLESTLNRVLADLERNLRDLEEATNITLGFVSDLMVVLYRAFRTFMRILATASRLFVQLLVLVLAFAFVGDFGYQITITSTGWLIVLAAVLMFIGWGIPLFLIGFLFWSYRRYARMPEPAEEMPVRQREADIGRQILRQGFSYLPLFDLVCAGLVMFLAARYGYLDFRLPPLSTMQKLFEWLHSLML